MTTQEAIKQLDGAQAMLFNRNMVKFNQAIIMAIRALQEQEERENPKPLTFEELKQLDGEPVWLDVAGGIFGLVDAPDRVVWLDRGGCFSIGNLEGKAYRHKPKEA